MPTKRLTPEFRRAQLLLIATRLAERGNYRTVTRAAVATRAKVAESLVSYYLGTVAQMRARVMREAVGAGNARIVAQGLAAGDRMARKASAAVRFKAVRLLAG